MSAEDFHLSAAAERNKTAIFSRLRKYLVLEDLVLEIGSGTGQHARYFSELAPFIKWLPTDLDEKTSLLNAYLKDSATKNIYPAIQLDVSETPWPQETLSCSTIYTANTFHIMALDKVQAFWRNLSQLKSCYKVIVYGPFTYNGEYTSESNKTFDYQLKAYDPDRGIRAFEDIDAMAEAAGFKLLHDHKMPANNQLIIWFKP